MSTREIVVFFAGVLLIAGLFVYKLETTDVEVWQSSPESEQYMKVK